MSTNNLDRKQLLLDVSKADAHLISANGRPGRPWLISCVAAMKTMVEVVKKIISVISKGDILARKKYSMTEARIRRFIKEGRGKGVGPNYKPWHMVSDVPSLGRVHRPYGNKTRRQHHLLSDNEYFAFLLFEWDDNIVDIREQYPFIDRRETMEIAARHGIRHPVDPQSGALWVITTDFLLTIRNVNGTSLIARTVKQAETLGNKRTLEKLEIERRLCERHHVEWKILTNQQLKNQFTANLAWIYDNNVLDLDSPVSIADEILCKEIARIKSAEPYVPIKNACRIIDERIGWSKGDALAGLRRLLWRKRITTNLNVPKLSDLPISEFEIAKGNLSHEE